MLRATAWATDVHVTPESPRTAAVVVEGSVRVRRGRVVVSASRTRVPGLVGSHFVPFRPRKVGRRANSHAVISTRWLLLNLAPAYPRQGGGKLHEEPLKRIRSRQSYPCVRLRRPSGGPLTFASLRRRAPYQRSTAGQTV